MRPDLVSILIRVNDLVKHRVDVSGLAAAFERTNSWLRDAGCDVVLVTPFLPWRRVAKIFASRIVSRTGPFLIHTDLNPELGNRPHWGEGLVHLSS